MIIITRRWTNNPNCSHQEIDIVLLQYPSLRQFRMNTQFKNIWMGSGGRAATAEEHLGAWAMYLGRRSEGLQIKTGRGRRGAKFEVCSPPLPRVLEKIQAAVLGSGVLLVILNIQRVLLILRNRHCWY